MIEKERYEKDESLKLIFQHFLRLRCIFSTWRYSITVYLICKECLKVLEECQGIIFP